MTLWQDLRFALRLLVKDHWFTVAAVSALALGLAANTTVFTFVGMKPPAAPRSGSCSGR